MALCQVNSRCVNSPKTDFNSSVEKIVFVSADGLKQNKNDFESVVTEKVLQIYAQKYLHFVQI